MVNAAGSISQRNVASSSDEAISSCTTALDGSRAFNGNVPEQVRSGTFRQAVSQSSRLDFKFAEFHVAGAVLQRDPALAMLGVGRFCRLHAVEHDGELWAFGNDLQRVPLAGGFVRSADHACGVHDTAGRIFLPRAGIEYVHLVAAVRADILRVPAADEDTAVGGAIRPDFGNDPEILVGLLGDQEAVPEVGPDTVFQDAPISVSLLLKILQPVRAVQERAPGGPFFSCVRMYGC